MDEIDRQLLTLLNDNARTSVADLARRVGMTSPSVSERLKRLEEAGVIAGYRVDISPQALGYSLVALVRIRPLPGKLKRVETLIREIPEVVECDKVTGDDCFIARLYLRDIAELDAVLERITDIAETNTAIVKTNLVPRRLLALKIPF